MGHAAARPIIQPASGNLCWKNAGLYDLARRRPRFLVRHADHLRNYGVRSIRQPRTVALPYRTQGADWPQADCSCPAQEEAPKDEEATTSRVIRRRMGRH